VDGLEDKAPAKASEIPEIPPGYVNRDTLKIETGLTETDLRILSAKGLLRASGRRDSTGRFLYRKSILPKLYKHAVDLRRERANTPGRLPPALKSATIAYTLEEGLMVFEMLKQGRAPVNISLETSIHPAVVHVIARDFEHMGGCLIIDKKELDQINKLTLPGAFPITKGAELLDVMQRAAEALMTSSRCIACQKRSRSYCSSCARSLPRPNGDPAATVAEQTPASPSPETPTPR
jgi:hypothetical protein